MRDPRPGIRSAVLVLSLALWLLPAAAAPQVPQPPVVVGMVVEGGSTTPVGGAMVVVLDGQRLVAQALSSSTGTFRITLPRAGRFTLRIDRLGYASSFSDPFDVADGAVVTRNVESRVAPIQLEGVSVEGSGRCEVRPEDGRATAVVWEEVRKALAAAAWTSERGMYRFAWTRFERQLSPDGRRVLREQRQVRSELGAQPFVSVPPEVLARDGFIRSRVDSITYAAPDANVLLSDAFLDTHCFALEQRQQGGEQLIGLRFEPIPGRRLPDIEGVLWLGRQTLRLRSVEYRYVNLPWLVNRHNAGGEVYFRGLPNGTWIVNEWTIRMLRLRESRDEFGRVQGHEVLGYTSEGSVVNVVATTAGEVVDRETGLGGVRGVVADSAGRPLSGARVWIEGTDFVATSGSGGRFQFDGVAAGLWSVGASHPELDAIGHAGILVDADVTRGELRDVRLDLPSVHAAAVSLCSEAPTGEDGRVLVGQVRDRNGLPARGAAVRVLWSLGRVQEGVGVQSDENGRFALCDLPATLRVRAFASLAEAESPVVELPAGRRGSVARVEMALASPQAEAPRGGASGASALAGVESEWLATKGFELRGARALLHQTRDEFQGRGLESIEKILTQVPRIEARKPPNGRIDYRLHAFENWTPAADSTAQCPLELFLNGSLVRARLPTLLNEYAVPGSMPGDEFRPLDLDRWLLPRDLTAVEVFDAEDVPVNVPGGCGAALFWTYRLDHEEDPEFTGSLQGQVLRVPANLPAEGVLVTIQPLGLERRTDRFGRFDFGFLPAARYRIDVVVPEWGPFSTEVMLRAGSRAEVSVQVQPPPGPPAPGRAGRSRAPSPQ